MIRRDSRSTTVLLAVLALALCLVPTLFAAPLKALHPPQTARIVEGVSAGGLSIGDTYPDMLALWGKADSCDSGNDGHNHEVVGCNWYEARQGLVRTGVGTLQVILAPPSKYGVPTKATKVTFIRLWDLKDTPGYRWKPVLTGWKTTASVGLRSTLAAVQKAYGSRLHTVPQPDPLPAGYFPTSYVVTKRSGKRWVTSFTFDRGHSGGPLKVHDIAIESYTAFAMEYAVFVKLYGPLK